MKRYLEYIKKNVESLLSHDKNSLVDILANDNHNIKCIIQDLKKNIDKYILYAEPYKNNSNTKRIIFAYFEDESEREYYKNGNNFELEYNNKPRNNKYGYYSFKVEENSYEKVYIVSKPINSYDTLWLFITSDVSDDIDNIIIEKIIKNIYLISQNFINYIFECRPNIKEKLKKLDPELFKAKDWGLL